MELPAQLLAGLELDEELYEEIRSLASYQLAPDATRMQSFVSRSARWATTWLASRYIGVLLARIEAGT